MRNRIRPAWAGAVLAAPAYPIRCTPGDNLAIHVGVARGAAGAALVVDVGEEALLGHRARCSPQRPSRVASRAS